MPARWRPVALAVTCATALACLAPAAPARADDVANAQARVDRLQSLVARTTQQLLAGTRRWEADRAALALVQLRLRTSQQRVAQAQQTERAGNALINKLARQLYMSPSPGRLQLAVTEGPHEFAQSVETLGSLNLAADSRSGIVRRARTARVHLLGEKAIGAQLAQQARDLVAASGKRLRGLEELAQHTSDQLLAAQRALAAARRAKSARDFVNSGALCTAKPIGHQQNGNLDPASLCLLWMGGGATLKASAANAFNRLSRYHAATVGGALCVSGGYRSYQRQVELYRERPGLAAVPGTSEHGWGNAVDLCGGVQVYGSAAYRWMRANAHNFGMFHPSWAEPSGSKPEPWHWEFVG